MRTKALLLTAALAAAGVATSMAQVYSVNAVGYVNKTLKPGFNLVSNPLTAANNTMGELFKGIQGTIPAGLSVYKFANGRFLDAIVWDPEEIPGGTFVGPTTGETVLPGEGVFVLNTGGTDLTLTFVGEVPQGAALSNPLPLGFSIRANMVPQDVAPDTLGANSIPGTAGDHVYTFVAGPGGGYRDYTYDPDEPGWLGANGVGLPVITAGEAFFMLRVNSAGAWTRSFSVNN